MNIDCIIIEKRLFLNQFFNKVYIIGFVFIYFGIITDRFGGPSFFKLIKAPCWLFYIGWCLLGILFILIICSFSTKYRKYKINISYKGIIFYGKRVHNSYLASNIKNIKIGKDFDFNEDDKKELIFIYLGKVVKLKLQVDTENYEMLLNILKYLNK